MARQTRLMTVFTFPFPFRKHMICSPPQNISHRTCIGGNVCWKRGFLKATRECCLGSWEGSGRKWTIFWSVGAILLLGRNVLKEKFIWKREIEGECERAFICIPSPSLGVGWNTANWDRGHSSLIELKMTGETPEVRSDKRKPRMLFCIENHRRS